MDKQANYQLVLAFSNTSKLQGNIGSVDLKLTQI